MDCGTSAANTVANEMRESFQDFIAKRSIVFPTIFSRMSGNGKKRARILSPFSLLSVNNFRVRNKKYIFFSARHAELIAQFAKDEAALIGGPRELRIAMKLGLPFCFVGDLYWAAYDILFGLGHNRPSWRSALVINRWVKFFSQQENPCYLIMPTDTLPIPLMLAKIAGESGNVRVVCVQHGLFNTGYKHDDIDGRNSQINLVYSLKQRAELLRRLPDALVEVMGYPAEYHCEAPRTSTPRFAVLVGTGALENMRIYDASLSIFKAIESVMKDIGFKVEYRPHPTERSVHYDKLGFAINREAKNTLLSDECKVFFGFTSTLLYEAHLAGHLAIVLNDPCLPGYSIEQFGVTIQTSDIERVATIVAQQWQRIKAQQVDYTPVLRIRFDEAIARGDQRLAIAVGRRKRAKESEPKPAKTYK